MSNRSVNDGGLLPYGLIAFEVPPCPHLASLPGPKTSQKKLNESSCMDTHALGTHIGEGHCPHVCVSEDSRFHTAACDSEEVNNG